MTSEKRIDAIEEHLRTLQSDQADLDQQFKQAHRDQWKVRIEDLQAQVKGATTSSTDRLKKANESLRGAWEHSCAQVDDASATASAVAETMRGGLNGAYTEVRDALAEARTKISS